MATKSFEIYFEIIRFDNNNNLWRSFEILYRSSSTVKTILSDFINLFPLQSIDTYTLDMVGRYKYLEASCLYKLNLIEFSE